MTLTMRAQRQVNNKLVPQNPFLAIEKTSSYLEPLLYLFNDTTSQKIGLFREVFNNEDILSVYKTKRRGLLINFTLSIV